MRIAYVTSNESDNFAWYAVNDGEEGLLVDAIRTDFDDDPEIDIMGLEHANELVDDIDIPDSVEPGTFNKFYYGS